MSKIPTDKIMFHFDRVCSSCNYEVDENYSTSGTINDILASGFIICPKLWCRKTEYSNIKIKNLFS